MLVNSTSVFRKSLAKLCKRPKYQYATCPQDICEELSNKTEVELIENNDQITMKGNSCLIKMRVANSGRNEGKSGGFRVIAFVSIDKQEVSLLEIYPKTGRYAQDTLLDDEKEYVLGVFIKERNEAELKVHNLTKQLKVEKEVEVYHKSIAKD
ncbi:hypothetical protein [Spirosoma areae]